MTKIIILSEEELDTLLVDIEKEALKEAKDSNIVDIPVDFYMGVQYALDEIRKKLND